MPPTGRICSAVLHDVLRAEKRHSAQQDSLAFANIFGSSGRTVGETPKSEYSRRMTGVAVSPHHDKPHDRQIDLVVIVSGQSQPVRIKPNQKLQHLVKEALHLTGNAGQAPSEWELRREDGSLLDQHLHAHEAGLVDGMVLFLNPHAGAGGC